MSRDRDRARVALEFLGEWFDKGIEAESVAYGLMSIDPELLPVQNASQIPAAVKAATQTARQGPITTPAGQAWLRDVIAAGLRLYSEATAAATDDEDDAPAPADPHREDAAIAEADAHEPLVADGDDAADFEEIGEVEDDADLPPTQ